MRTYSVYGHMSLHRISTATGKILVYSFIRVLIYQQYITCSSYRNYLRVLSHYIGTYRHIRVLVLSEVIYRHTGTCITLGTNYRRLITDIRVLTVDAGRADHVHDGFIVRVQLQGLHQGEYVIHVNVDFSVDCDQLERCLNG